jgi:hypothetical protein
LHLAEQKAQRESLLQRTEEERGEAKKAEVEERRLDRLATEEGWRARQAEQTAHQEVKEKAQRAIDDAALEEVRQNAIIDRDASSNASKRTIEMQMNMFEWMKDSKAAQDRKERREVEEYEYRMTERRRVAEERAASERASREAERQRETVRNEELKREETARTAAAKADSEIERKRVADQQALDRHEAEIRALGSSVRERDASHTAQSIDDTEIDDWANHSPEQQCVETRREERSGVKKTAAAEPSLASRMAKEAEELVTTPVSGAAATIAPSKRPKRGAAAAVVGN